MTRCSGVVIAKFSTSIVKTIETNETISLVNDSKTLSTFSLKM